jgi:alpha-L-rhamnosidase
MASVKGSAALLFLCLSVGLAVPGSAAQDEALRFPAPIDPRGPIENLGMRLLVGEQGVQTPDYAFVNTCRKPSPWKAQWITPASGEPAAACFRKEITLADTPQSVNAWLSADTKYRLYINGKLVSRGPVDIGRDYFGGSTGHWFYDYRDLTPFFKKGKNVIAAEVFKTWPFGFVVSRGHLGFLFEAELTLPNQRAELVKSDPTWRTTPADYFSEAATHYDAGKEPAGWRMNGFDDSSWGHCAAAGEFWNNLTASEIPPLMEARYPIKTIDNPTGGVHVPDKPFQDGHNITVDADGGFTLVFDRVLSAYPTIKVKGGKGAQIAIKVQHRCVMTLGDGEQYFEFPFMVEVVPSFRVEVSHITTPLEIQDVGAVFTSQPVQYRGTFECSDDKLNQIWKAARWAVQICLQTHHMDSPNHQEPISDPGDYLIESMVNYAAFDQPWLARQDIRKFAWVLRDEKYHNFHTSYSLGWLQMLMDYYDHTGDKALIVEMAPYVHELLDTYATWRGKHGLISEAPNYMFMDWVEIGGFACHHPPAVIGQGYLTAFYYQGLENASRVARIMGDTARVAKYRGLRTEIAAAFNRELWVPEKGLYRDGKPFQSSVKPYEWLPADRDVETFSPHVNCLAVLYDLAPKNMQQPIMDKVLAGKHLNTQPWFMHWVFQAIGHAGVFDQYGIAQMRRWQVVHETQSFREMWNSGDLSHGWCSTPLVQLSSVVLGVTPEEPGFKLVSIRPTLCDLDWASGKVPTPHGDVAVSCAVKDGKLTLDVTVPQGTEANITVPTSRFDQPLVTEDGQSLPAGTAPPEVRVAAGTYQFTVTGTLKPVPASLNASAGLMQAKTNTDSADAFEADVLKADLIHAGPASALVRIEDHAAHAGGGSNADALVNGTTHNGSGSGPTLDDGKTFRGYGTGDSVTFYLDTRAHKAGYDITGIRTFAGHLDSRASQNYTVLFALATAPLKFIRLTSASVQCDGGASELLAQVKNGDVLNGGPGAQARGVVAVRFEFEDGSTDGGGGQGFDVYREINIVGTPTAYGNGN